MALFAIVEFLLANKESNEVEIVPISWLNEDKNRCYWPPDKSLVTVRVKVKKLIPPQPHWTLYEAKCKKVFANYVDARAELPEAERRSDYGETEEEFNEQGEKKRRKRRPSHFGIDSGNSDEDVDDLLPPAPKVGKLGGHLPDLRGKLDLNRQEPFHQMPQELHNIMPQELHNVMPQELHNVMPQELHNVMPQELHNVMQQEHNVIPQEHNIMPQEHNVMPQEHNVMPQENNVMPQELHDVMPQELHNVMPQELHSPMTHEPYIMRPPATSSPRQPTKYIPRQAATLSPRQPAMYSPRDSATYSPRHSATYSQKQPATYSQRQPTMYSQRQPTMYSQRQPTMYSQRQPATYSQRQPATYTQRQPAMYSPRQQATYSQRQQEEFSQGSQEPHSQMVHGSHSRNPYVSSPLTASSVMGFSDRVEEPSGMQPYSGHNSNCCPCSKTMASMMLAMQKELAQHTRILNSLLLNNNKEILVRSTLNNLPVPLPLRQGHDVQGFENYLREDSSFNACVLYFATLGGSTIKDTIRNLMQHLMTNEIAVDHNMKGRGSKKSFEEYPRILNMIYRATIKHSRFSEATVTDIKILIKDWLRHSKDRLKAQKRNQGPEENRI